MNEREMQALDALKSSRKYGDLCEDTLERVFLEELQKRKNLKDVDKQTRARLHQITGAFMTREQLKRARACLDRYAEGDHQALIDALTLHASTAERLPVMDELYDRTLNQMGKPTLILDLACGLNPLYLGSKGHCARGYDIHGGTNQLVNDWAARCGMDVQAQTRDVTLPIDYPAADLALIMKLLPVLEQQRKGSAMQLLMQLPARHLLVSFPTRTLGGRGVGMEGQYTAWFEGNLPPEFNVLDRFVIGTELCYLLEGKHG